MRDYLFFHLNGQAVQIRGCEAFAMLAPWLRGARRLTGTKIACAHGACGSCSVLIGRPNQNGELDYQPVNACILPMFAVDGAHVVTVEGLNGPFHVGGADDGTISAVQRALVECHGAQCGFCTPGIAVTLTAFSQNQTFNSKDEVCSALEGNLCRCTGYAPIIDAALSVETADLTPLSQLYPARALLASSPDNGVEIEAEQHLFAPISLAEAARWKAAHPGAVVIAGATEIGVQMSVNGLAPRAILSLARVENLDEIQIEDGALMLGARATWTRVEAFAQTAFPELAAWLKRWGSPQLRNAGTVAGSLANVLPNSDSLPLLLVCEAQLELVGATGARLLGVAEFVADKTLLRADELIHRVRVPMPSNLQKLRLFKVSKRRAFDRSIVSAAFLLTLENKRIEEVKIAFGCVAPRAIRLDQTEAFLRGQTLQSANWREAANIARGEIAPISDGAASAEYRARLVGNLVLKFGHEIK